MGLAFGENMILAEIFHHSDDLEGYSIWSAKQSADGSYVGPVEAGGAFIDDSNCWAAPNFVGAE